MMVLGDDLLPLLGQDGSYLWRVNEIAEKHGQMAALAIFTVHHLTYGPDGTVQSVQKESRRDTSHDGDAQD